MKRGTVLLMAVVAMVFVWGCRVTPHGAVVADVNPKGWEPTEEVELLYENDDTVSLRTISIVARREVDKSAEPLGVCVSVCAPDSSEVKGAVVLVPQSDNRGGSFAEMETLWVQNAKLQSGVYRFLVSPRQPSEGVWSVGVEIEVN